MTTLPDLTAIAGYVNAVGDDTADMLHRGTLDADRLRADIAGAAADAAVRLAAQYRRDGDADSRQSQRSYDRGNRPAGDRHAASAAAYYAVARDLTQFAQLLRCASGQG